jgi:hypothetical protein
MENNKYDQQAAAFLNATSTGFIASFKTHDYYFDEDKEPRDIYNCTLVNKKHRFRFTFGQAPASTGTAPRPYDVLACITKSDPGTFEDFCWEFGYDTDSRKAFKTYKAVMREWKNVEKLFTEEQLEQLREIQ